MKVLEGHTIPEQVQAVQTVAVSNMYMHVHAHMHTFHSK